MYLGMMSIFVYLNFHTLASLFMCVFTTHCLCLCLCVFSLLREELMTSGASGVNMADDKKVDILLQRDQTIAEVVPMWSCYKFHLYPETQLVLYHMIVLILQSDWINFSQHAD